MSSLNEYTFQFTVAIFEQKPGKTERTYTGTRPIKVQVKAASVEEATSKLCGAVEAMAS